MQKNIQIRVAPEAAASDDLLLPIVAEACGLSAAAITGYHIIRKSLDARSRQLWVNLTLHVFINEPFHDRQHTLPIYKDVTNAQKRAVVIGAGPAGLFAALKLIEAGVRPIILERGKDLRARRRDLAAINKEGKVNPESNYCFGEGGAGTYSDGKLYTRSTKRGNVNHILSVLHFFGADERILYEAHPHIGTNKLPHIITAMRDAIRQFGGLVLFENKVVDLKINGDKVEGVYNQHGALIEADAFVLATGHSARDIFHLLHQKKLLIEEKPFALGVRVEHPQALIDQIQYHCTHRGEYLPAASYSLVEQVDGKGVFSFCMCPGGIIAPAATNENEIVVNGWSPSKRNNPYANSGIVVAIDRKELMAFQKHGALAGLYFQQSVEQNAFRAGGGRLVAPAQRLADFTVGKLSASLPACSYLPGIAAAPLQEVLPSFVHQALQDAFKAFGRKMKGYLTNEAVVVATESRTSSPVRIPRTEALHHPQLKNLYPCGEGAGYAGGIVSAAMDGERVAYEISQR